MCALWLAKTFTATDTPGDTANHWLFTPSYLICVSQQRQNMLANQIWVLYTHKSCPIVRELALWWRVTELCSIIKHWEDYSKIRNVPHIRTGTLGIEVLTMDPGHHPWLGKHKYNMVQGATPGRVPMLRYSAIRLISVNMLNLQNESSCYLLLPE